jgi:hypothetical protein
MFPLAHVHVLAGAHCNALPLFPREPSGKCNMHHASKTVMTAFFPAKASTQPHHVSPRFRAKTDASVTFCKRCSHPQLMHQGPCGHARHFEWHSQGNTDVMAKLRSLAHWLTTCAHFPGLWPIISKTAARLCNSSTPSTTTSALKTLHR